MFVVVGLVVAGAAAVAAFILCKRRRRRRIRQSISRPLPYPDNPFEDPRVSPSPTQMRYASDSSHRNLVGAGVGAHAPMQRNLLDEEFDDVVPIAPLLAHTSAGRHSRENSAEMAFAGVGAGGLMGAFPLFGGLSREAAVLLVEAGKLNVSARFADLGGRGG